MIITLHGDGRPWLRSVLLTLSLLTFTDVICDRSAALRAHWHHQRSCRSSCWSFAVRAPAALLRRAAQDGHGLRRLSGERAERGEAGDWAGVGALLRAPTARVWVHGAWVRAGAQCACPGRRNGRRAVSPAEVCRAVAGGSLSAACSAASSCHVGRKRPRALAHVTNNRYTRRYTLDTQRRYTISLFRPT